VIDPRSRWQRTTLTREFMAESCTFADMNGDGRDELVAGDSWWDLDRSPCLPTTFRTIADAWLPPWGGGEHRVDPHAHLRETSRLPPQYKAATYDWPIRHPGGGPDSLLSVGMHRDPVRWFEHRPARGPWAGCEVTAGGIYESAVYTELDTSGTRGLVTVSDRPRIAWYEPGCDPYTAWTEHLVGEHGGSWHGLGVGALEDERPHILTPTGIYTPGCDIRRPWHWSPLRQIDENGHTTETLGDVCLIHTHQIGASGPASLFGASPHARGLWRWDLLEVTASGRLYQRYCLDRSTSQLHALAVLPAMPAEPVDAWVITGKRWQAHGPDHDIDPRGTPRLFRVGVHTDPRRRAVVELIDDQSGVGLNFAARRLADGRMQIATANKLGVHLFTEHHQETVHGK